MEHAQSREGLGLISVVQMSVRSDNEASDVTLVEGDGLHWEIAVAITPAGLSAGSVCAGFVSPQPHTSSAGFGLRRAGVRAVLQEVLSLSVSVLAAGDFASSP